MMGLLVVKLLILLGSLLAAESSIAVQIEDVYKTTGCEKEKECKGVVISVRKVNVIKVVLQNNTSQVFRLAGVIPSENEKLALAGKKFLESYLNMDQIYPTVKIEKEGTVNEAGEISAYVFYHTVLVNGEIIRRGLGKYDGKTGKYKELLKQLEDEAKKQKRGLFSDERK